MPASYPSAIKIFSTKASGDVIRAAHITALEDEVSAIETALRNGFNHDLLFTDATYDIGKSGATRPRDLFLSRNCTIGGTLAATGAVTFSGALSVTGTTTCAALLDLSGASAGQVKFPATQNPSSDANTFDDYEEGTWTVTDASGAGLSLTTVQTARYVKKGQDVFVSGAITFPATANASNAALGGLPFTLAATAAGLAIGYSDLGSAFHLQAPASGTTIIPWSLAGARMTNATWSGKTIYFSGNYQASA